MTEELELRITRIYDAPASLVFDCWADPKKIVEWSAPEGLSLDESEGEFKQGSYFKTTMRGPDFAMVLRGDYLEIVENEKIVHTHTWFNPDGSEGETTTVTVTFKDVDGKCEMEFLQTGFDSVESRDGHGGGWGSCFDKLGILLGKLQ